MHQGRLYSSNRLRPYNYYYYNYSNKIRISSSDPEKQTLELLEYYDKPN